MSNSYWGLAAVMVGTISLGIVVGYELANYRWRQRIEEFQDKEIDT